MLARMIRHALVFVFVVVFASVASAGPSVAQLAKDRAAAAEKAFTSAETARAAGAGSVEMVGEWSVRWLEAAIAAGTRTKPALADHLARMTKLEAEVGNAVKAGTARASDAQAAEYFRIEAAYWVARGRK